MAVAFAVTPFEKTTGSSASFAKVRASNFGAGSLLFCFTWQYSATNTCTGVADDINGAWVKAFGPQRGDSNNSDGAVYGWYKVNSAAGGSPTAGTVTATWSGSTNGGILIGEVTGLAGGGALDQFLNATPTGSHSDVSLGVTAVLAQAAEAVVAAGISNNGLAPPHGSFSNQTIDAFQFERFLYQITAATTALDVGWSHTGTGTTSGVAMAFKDASVPAVPIQPFFPTPLLGPLLAQ